MDALASLRVISNATKAQIATAVNALLLVVVAFHVVLTDTQVAAIGIGVNAVLALFTATTFTQSAKRIPGA